MLIHDILNRTNKLVRENTSGILVAVGVSGTVTTAYLSGVASYRASSVIKEHESIHGTADTKKQRAIERGRLVWKLYIPTIASGALTVTSIIAVTRVGSKRVAALTAAATISEKAFAEYKEKVIEQIGENKEQSIRDAIAADKIKETSEGREVLILGSGDVLCCELYTGRYFNSSMESLRRAQNDVNAMLLREDTCTLSDFYYLLGLPTTQTSSYMGWDSTKLLELEFSTTLTEDNRPCMAFAYNYVHPF